VRAWSELRAWRERSESERFCVCIVCPNSFSLSCSLWVRNHARANRVKERARTDAVMGTYVGISVSDRQRDGDRVKEVLASGVPPKGLEARAFTFGGTEGSML